jgi:hypothetical protein
VSDLSEVRYKVQLYQSRLAKSSVNTIHEMNGSLAKSAQIGREELTRPASCCFPRGKQQDDEVLVVQDDAEEGGRTCNSLL